MKNKFIGDFLFVPLRWCSYVVIAITLISCSQKNQEPDPRQLTNDQVATSTDDSLEHLMKAVFPTWTADPDQTFHANVIKPSAKSALRVQLTPSLVVRLSPNELVLIVQGRVSDSSDDDPLELIPLKGNSSAYWFKRENNLWHLTARKEPFSETGINGFPGAIKTTQLEIGPQARYLVQETENNEEGFFDSYLDFFQIGSNGYVKSLTPSIHLASSNTGASIEECNQWIKHPHPPKIIPLKIQGPDIEVICHDVQSTWTIEPSKGEPYAHLVLKGHKDSVSFVNQCALEAADQSPPIVQPAASTTTTANAELDLEASAPSPQAPACDTAVVRPYHAKITAVYKLVNGRWVVIKGFNPIGKEFDM